MFSPGLRVDQSVYSQIQSRVFMGRRLGREQSMSDHQGLKPGDSKRQKERKSPAKSEYTAERGPPQADAGVPAGVPSRSGSQPRAFRTAE